MNSRPLFSWGAAILFAIATLTGIAGFAGDFGDPHARLLETCCLAFLCGATALAGAACLDRGIVRHAVWAAVAFGVCAYAVRADGAWGACLFAALVVPMLRLVSPSARLLRTGVPAAWGAAVVAAAIRSERRFSAGEWKFELSLVALVVLGYALSPLLQRFWVRETAPATRTGAVSARGRLAPLADLGLLAAVAAAPPLALSAYLSVNGNAGVLSGAAVCATAVGAAMVVFIRREALRAKTLGIAVATGVILSFGNVVTFIFVLCGTRPNQPWVPVAGMVVVYFGVGMWSLRRRFLWGVPLAVLLAFVAFLTLWSMLPGTPQGCFE